MNFLRDLASTTVDKDTPSSSDHTDFATNISSGTVVRTFTISFDPSETGLRTATIRLNTM